MNYADRVLIADLKRHVEKEVMLAGWLYRNRPSGKVQFLTLRDGSGLCQCVIEKGKIDDDLFAKLKHLGQEPSLAITGTIREEQICRNFL